MGFETVSRFDVAETLDNEGQGALSPDAVMVLAREANCPEAEALVLSCTDMRSVERLARIEGELGKPVICSNQAMMFEALRALGIGAPVRRFGRLLERNRL